VRGAVKRSIAGADGYRKRQSTVVKVELVSYENTIEALEDLQNYEKPEILELRARDAERRGRGHVKRVDD